MISDQTPYKLAEIIRDTWPNIYRPPAPLTNGSESARLPEVTTNEMILEIQENEDGELFLEFPEDIVESLGWIEGDTLQWVVAGESIILKKIND